MAALTLFRRRAPRIPEIVERRGADPNALTLWGRWHRELAPLADRQLFFIGGTPRSGTTWLQQMLDAHPGISCRGEAHFMKGLAAPLDTVMIDWRKALEAKNRSIFSHTGGYQLPDPDDADFLAGAAILLALQRQNADKNAQAIGERRRTTHSPSRGFSASSPAPNLLGSCATRATC
jgi:hypothetical protein